MNALGKLLGALVQSAPCAEKCLISLRLGGRGQRCRAAFHLCPQWLGGQGLSIANFEVRYDNQRNLHIFGASLGTA